MITPTNVTLWMALTVLAITALFVLGTRGRAIIPSRIQSVAELAYGFIHKMVEDVAGKDALKFFPYIFTVFCFIVFSNFLGLLPKAFTTTSHIAVTAILAMAVFLTVTIVGFVKNGAGFLSLFWVSSAPLPLRPILALIEVISYFVRPVSHSIRLAGNMMAGHAVIKVFAAFAPLILISGIGVAVTPLSIVAITAMYGLEVLVAFIQAYVFTILTCVYLKDALHPHH
jgi:F-type H+-transporting ATPase subunit a